MIAMVIAASSSSDILEVIAYGAIAGVGVSIAFSLMLRGFLVFGIAKRDGRKGVAMAHGAMGVFFAVVCVIAVVGGLASMLHRETPLRPDAAVVRQIR